MKRFLEVLARGPEAIACRLSPEDLVERGSAWRAVRSRAAIVDRSRFEGGFQIVLEGSDADLEEVSRLVAAERQCCDWAEWKLEAEAGRATLTVAGEEALIAPLATAMLEN